MTNAIILSENFSYDAKVLYQLDIVDDLVRKSFKRKIFRHPSGLARIEISKMETAIRSVEFDLMMQGYFNSSSAVTAKFLCIKKYFYQKK